MREGERCRNCCLCSIIYGDQCWTISPPPSPPPLKGIQMLCRQNVWGAVIFLLGQLINKHILGAVPRAMQQFCEMEEVLVQDSWALPKVQKPLFLLSWPVLSQQYFDCSPIKTLLFSLWAVNVTTQIFSINLLQKI